MNARASERAGVAREERPQRMDFLSRLPLFFSLEGRQAMVAGGSPAATWKAELLSAAGAKVHVCAASPCEELLLLAADPPRGEVIVYGRHWEADDLPGCALAIGACDNDQEADAFAAAARAAGVPVNVIDRPAFCDFSFGSIVNRSPLVVGISTGGAAPMFAQAVRAQVEMLLPRGFARWIAAAARWRNALKRAGLTFAGRRKFWELFTAHALAHPATRSDEPLFDRFLAQVRGLGPLLERGSLTLIETGSADPEQLTLQALRALRSADVIVLDHGISPAVHDFARREAKNVAGTHGNSLRNESDLEQLSISLARSGKRVVRVIACDALSLGHARQAIAAGTAGALDLEMVARARTATVQQQLF